MNIAQCEDGPIDKIVKSAYSQSTIRTQQMYPNVNITANVGRHILQNNFDRYLEIISSISRISCYNNLAME